MITLTMAMAQKLAARLVELADALEDRAARDRLQTLMDRTSTGIFQLVVVGEIKKGKSSFINALLGVPDLLPALSDVATSTVFQVSWGHPLLRQGLTIIDTPDWAACSNPTPRFSGAMPRQQMRCSSCSIRSRPSPAVPRWKPCNDCGR